MKKSSDPEISKLQRAMSPNLFNAEPVRPNQKLRETDTALDAAVKKITSMTRMSNITRERVMETGQSLIQTAEMQGANALASTARGYFGADKITYGGVDGRAIGGVGLMGFGIYQLLTGGKGGEHALNIGNGVLSSYTTEVGINAGMRLREDYQKPQPPPNGQANQAQNQYQQQYAPLYPQQSAAMRGEPGSELVRVPDWAGPQRNMYMSDEANGAPKQHPVLMTPPQRPATAGEEQESSFIKLK